MSFPVQYNGVTYLIPVYGDVEWGPDVTKYLNALATGSLTRAGGLFALQADVNFGALHGILAKYYGSAEANPATGGTVRLTNSNTINWRNFANTGDLTVGVNGANQLTFNNIPIADSARWGFITGDIVDQTDLQAQFATKADVSDPLFTATGYLFANTGAPASFSPTVPATDISGQIDVTTQIQGIVPIANGGTNSSTASGAFENLSPLSATGDVLVYSSGTNTRLPVSPTDGFVLTADSTSAFGVSYQAPGVVPVINSQGQVPYFIPGSDTYICDTNKQVLFTLPITIEGYLQIDGYLVEVA